MKAQRCRMNLENDEKFRSLEAPRVCGGEDHRAVVLMLWEHPWGGLQVFVVALRVFASTLAILECRSISREVFIVYVERCLASRTEAEVWRWTLCLGAGRCSPSFVMTQMTA